MCYNVWGQQYYLLFNSFCPGFDKWLGYDVVIMGSLVTKGSPQCRHSGTGRKSEFCFGVFECWHLSVSVLVLKSFQ